MSSIISTTKVIGPDSGWKSFDFKELWAYRDLFWLFTLRTIKGNYAQSIFGFGWALVKPLVTMIMFTLVFGKLAKISSDGMPYAIFSFAALVPWNYFSTALTSASSSLLGASSMISKVYFPRIILPLSSLLSALVEFLISFLLLMLLMIYYKVPFTLSIFYIPLLVLIIMFFAGGAGFWLSSIAIQFRDIKFGIAYMSRILMYLSPVIYPYSMVPEQYKFIYSLNPMVGVVEGFRSVLLHANPIPWNPIFTGLIVSLLLFISGAFFFHKSEKVFADVI